MGLHKELLENELADVCEIKTAYMGFGNSMPGRYKIPCYRQALNL